MFRNAVVIGLCWILALEAFFPGVNLADASHLPDLLNHYQKHKLQSPEITFTEFLSLHYEDSNHLASSPSDHKDLPFSKRLHNTVTSVISQLMIVSIPESTYIIVVKSADSHNRGSQPIGIASSVWQPPRA
jgi:hypothetical protein